MQRLGFSQTVSNSAPEFSTVQFFDEYFSFSGKKFRVIEPCTVDGKRGYLVEQQDRKQNMLLTILKVISFMTLIVPLVMGIGKLIARSRYSFFLKTNKTPHRPESPKTPDTQLLVYEQDAREIADSMRKFKKNALFALQNPLQEQPNLDFTITDAQTNLLLQANARKYERNFTIPGLKSIRGGINHVFFLDTLPGFVFKPMESKEDGDAYIKEATKARQTVVQHNLSLLQVSQSRLLEIRGQFFIMQEKADLIAGSYKEQEGIYSYCWHDREMVPFIKTVFLQMLCFIAQTGFSDVKYDNIPFTEYGKVALIDLDTTSALSGLTSGQAQTHNGLFHYIPPEYLNEFLITAKEHLSENTYQLLVQQMGDIKTRTEKKAKKHADYSRFVQKNSLSCPTQSMNPILTPCFHNDEKKQQLARFLIESCNQKLSKSKNFDMKTGRTITLAINTTDSLTNKARALWGQDFSFPSFISHILPEISEGLKTAGQLFTYKIRPQFNHIKVLC